VVGWYCKNSARTKKEGLRVGCVVALGIGLLLGVVMGFILASMDYR
jgi:tetrahydromethanopterin S-methyltransferase subunit G